MDCVFPTTILPDLLIPTLPSPLAARDGTAWQLSPVRMPRAQDSRVRERRDHARPQGALLEWRAAASRDDGTDPKAKCVLAVGSQVEHPIRSVEDEFNVVP